MRVLHIVSNISYRSGIMSFLMNYYRMIDKNKIQFDFMYWDVRNTGDYQSEIEGYGGRVIKIESPLSFWKFRSDIKSLCLENQNTYSVVQLHDPFLVLFFWKLKHKLNAKAFISHAHSTRFSDGHFAEIRNKLFCMPNKWLPVKLMACSNVAGESIFGRRFLSDGTVINNAIKAANFENSKEKRIAIRQKLGLQDKFVVGHIGNFTLPKNHEFIVDVFFSLLQQKIEAVLVLVGDGDQRNYIQEKCKSLKIESKVLFLGVRQDVSDIYTAFDRFLFPSLYEGFGIALIEAQAAGIPCIYSDIIPKETNILKTNNVILPLNLGVEPWVRALLDDNLEVKMSTASIIRECGFDIDIEKDKLVNLYEDMIR